MSTTDEKAHKTAIRARNGIGLHHCMTTEEVAQEKLNRKAPPPKLYLGREIQQWGVWLAWASVLAIVTSVIWGTFYTTVLACLMGAAGVFLGGITPARDQPTDDLESLSIRELKELEEIAAKVPAVNEAVAIWLAEGKTLRRRDYVACEWNAEKWLVQQERKQVLERLAKGGGAETAISEHHTGEA